MKATTTLVAVYGSLLEGLGNHRVLGGSPLVCRTRVAGLRLVSLDACPAALPGGDGIEVEVYEVNPGILRRLDQLEGYCPDRPEASMYRREVVQTANGLEVETYVWANPARLRNAPAVPGGDWRAQVEAGAGGYSWRSGR